MRWFKHFSDSLDDPFIQELIDHFGPAGYMAWFGLLEIIARENGYKLTGRLSVSPLYLSRKLRISAAKLQRVFNHCATAAKLSFESDSGKWNFYCPKILKLKDNYTKDLQAARKKPSKHKEVEEEVEKEEEKDTKTKKKASVFILPDWVPEKAWAGFIEMRVKIRAPLTDLAKKLQLDTLKKLRDEGHDPAAVLNESTMKGWKGLFPIKNGGGNGKNTGNHRQDTKTGAGGVKAPADKYAGVARTYPPDP